MPAPDFTTVEALAVLTAAAEALVALKADVVAANAKLEPLIQSNGELAALAADLKNADLAVDAEIARISEILNPTVVVEPVDPEPITETEREPVVEPTE